jgi:hypothetical protein
MVEYPVYVHNIVPSLKDYHIKEAVLRVIQREYLVGVKSIHPMGSKRSKFIIYVSRESTQLLLFRLKRLYVKEYVLRMEPSVSSRFYDHYCKKNPPRLKIRDLPPLTKPFDLKAACLDAKAAFWEIPWSNSRQMYENFAIVEFDSIADAQSALKKPVVVRGKELKWEVVSLNLEKEPPQTLTSNSNSNSSSSSSSETRKLPQPQPQLQPVKQGIVSNKAPLSNPSSSLASASASKKLLLSKEPLSTSKGFSSIIGDEPRNLSSIILGSKRSSASINEVDDKMTSAPATKRFQASESPVSNNKNENYNHNNSNSNSNNNYNQNNNNMQQSFFMHVMDKIINMQNDYMDKTHKMMDKSTAHLEKLYSILKDQSRFQEKILEMMIERNNDSPNQLQVQTNNLKSQEFLFNLGGTGTGSGSGTGTTSPSLGWEK